MIKLQDLLNEGKYTVYFDVGSPGLMSKTVDAKNGKEAALKVSAGISGGAKIKKVVKERYVSKRSDTIGDVFQSAVDSLEDLSDLFKKHAPKEKLVSSTLEKQSMMVRRMISKSKSYPKIKDMRND